MALLKKQWQASGEQIYRTGFADSVMRRAAGGVGLFDMELFEDDAAGAGLSEKGVCADEIWGECRGRKVFVLDEPAAHGAWLIFFIPCNLPAHHRAPLQVEVNGHRTELPFWDWGEKSRFHSWLPFAPEWLKAGENVVEISCPQAAAKEEGWSLCVARADEFAEGGGEPRGVGRNSFRSTDAGKTWKEGILGPEDRGRAEYSIRLSLDRHLRQGWLATPVIDLWRGDDEDFIIPLRILQKMWLDFSSEVPEGTAVEYYLRLGEGPSPLAQGWSPYEYLGEGAHVEVDLEAARLGRRYAQLKVVLKSQNPLLTPAFKALRLQTEVEQKVPSHDNLAPVALENPTITYATVEWQWEDWERPEHEELRRRENLDEMIAGSRTQFEAQVRLLDHVTRRWAHSSPMPAYPAWDALSILDRVERSGGGGMCIQFNNVLAGLCTACGWQARLTVVSNHEVCEVWNDDFGKWIFLDADFYNNYNCDSATGEPLNMLELHRHHLDYYYADRSIDFMADPAYIWRHLEVEPPPVRRGSPTGHERSYLTGFCNAAFMHLVPRNNWYSAPTPRPLSHGTTDWPWNGYVAWYDERTPRRRQYARHTDRVQDLWPDLNKVRVHATAGLGSDRLFLHFETYTPNFDHFEVDVDDSGWKEVGERWVWMLGAGRNSLRARAVNKSGARGKPACIALNYVSAPFAPS